MHAMQPTYKTIVISDLHLGSKGAKAKEVNDFLKSNSCHQLILNGDIIDGWQLKKGGSWKKKHTGFFRAVLKMMDRFDTEVIYLRGNHDDFLDQILPLKIGKQFSIRQDYMLSSHGKKYFITHGDIFDSITSQMKWLAYLGDIGYTFLLWLNKWYNQYRTWQGKPYYSLSQAIKQKVKAAVNFISDFEEKGWITTQFLPATAQRQPASLLENGRPENGYSSSKVTCRTGAINLSLPFNLNLD
jgi:UDP-2,3-diacylglucosamine pyrophosphatase LpxH